LYANHISQLALILICIIHLTDCIKNLWSIPTQLYPS